MPTPTDEPITLSGRVVVFESCLSKAGCQAASGLRVSLLADSGVASEPTGHDGAFTLVGVPRQASHELIVNEVAGAGRFLPTLQAKVVKAGTEDQYGLELFALEVDGGLYQAAVAELGVRVEAVGLYLGQVVEIDDGQMKAIDGVAAEVNPAADAVWYVRDNPRFNPGEVAFFPVDRVVTGVFGQFLVVAPGTPRRYAVATRAASFVASSLEPRIGAGHITVGVHELRASGP